jgi:hypothetical protein
VVTVDTTLSNPLTGSSLRDSLSNGDYPTTSLEINDLNTLTVGGKNVGENAAHAATQTATAAAVQQATSSLTNSLQEEDSSASITTAQDFQETTETLVSDVAQDLLSSGASPQAVEKVTQKFDHEIQEITHQIASGGSSSQAIHQGLSNFVDAAAKILDDSAVEYTVALEDLERAASSGEFSKQEAIAWHKLIGYSGARLAMDGFIVSFGESCSLVAKSNRLGYEDEQRAQQAKSTLRHSINSLGVYGKWGFNLVKEESIDGS